MLHSVDISALETNLYVNGEYVPASSGKKFPSVNPANEEVIVNVSEAGEADVNAAVAAAEAAFAPGSEWRSLSAYDRGALMHKFADLLEERSSFFAELETLDNGKPTAKAGTNKYGSTIDVMLAVKCFRYFAGWCDKVTGTTIPTDANMFCCTVKEPVGVCALIIPWNFPLLMAAWKLGPCLASGCVCVLKTSEKTPLSGLQLGALFSKAGFPKGVVNILSGDGKVGALLSKHMKVAKVAFTGSTAVGHKIMQMSSETNLKRVSLELGGKSPLIICSDADIDQAVSIANMGLFLNHGQCCCAGSRLFVQEDIYDKFVKKAVKKAEEIEVKEGLVPTADQGPQVDRIQFDKILDYIKSGVDQGAKLLTGGERLGTKGFFIKPTVFADVSDDMKIAKEEIFGPVQSILKFKTIDEVIERANNTIYGLAAGVISKDITTCMKIAKGLQAGTVWINCYNNFDVAAPFGGYKESGHGRDKGAEALDNYLETKTIMFPC